MKPTAVAALVLVSCSLTACGGGSAADESSTSPQAGAEPAAGHASSGSAAEQQSPPSGQAATPRSRTSSPPRRAGGTPSKARSAAAFKVKGGDNSVPEYGSEAPTSLKGQAAAALAAYLTAREEENWAAVCNGLAGQIRDRLSAYFKGSGGKPQGCPAIVKALSGSAATGSARSPFDGSLAAFRVKGVSAFALFYGPEGQKYVMPMAREGSDWKVTQLLPIPYPPGSAPAHLGG